MVLDVPDLEPSSSDDEEDSYFDQKPNGRSTDKNSQSLGRLHIGHMLQSVLQDAQTRLFFKAQNVVQSDIRNYTAKAEDLYYPKALQGVPFAAAPTIETYAKTVSGPGMQTPVNRRSTGAKIMQRKTCYLSNLHRSIRMTSGIPL